jgi:glucosylceramidase
MVSETQTAQQAQASYPPLFDDANTAQYISIAGYHGYNLGAFDPIADLHQRYPGIPLWMTEICAGGNSGQITSFISGEQFGSEIFGHLEAGAAAWIYWNMILDENGGPWLVSFEHGDPDPNAQNSVVTINRTTHEVTYNGLYYYIAHFSKFVRPGAVRIETRTQNLVNGIDEIAFRNSDGSLVTVLMNTNSSNVDVGIKWHDCGLRLSLPARSITTLTWD